MTTGKYVTTLVDMSEVEASLERAVAMLGLRSHLVEMAVHGDAEWTITLMGNPIPVECGVGLDDSGAVIVSYFLANAPCDADAYHLHANGVFVQSVEGKITKGRACRLRMKFPVEEPGYAPA